MYLSGRAMQLGTFNFTLSFMDSVGAQLHAGAVHLEHLPLTNSYFTLPLAGTTLAVGTPYTQPLLVFGGSNTYTFQAFTALPAGLSTRHQHGCHQRHADHGRQSSRRKSGSVKAGL